MYKQQFGLRKQPFYATVTGTDVFVGPQASAATEKLKNVLCSRDAIATVTGPAGIGKTTLTNKALVAIGENRKIIQIGRIRLEIEDVLDLLLVELNIQPKPQGIFQKFTAFRRRLLEFEDTNTRVFVVVEDALRLGAETLAELEALTAADAGTSGGANIILMADDQLHDLLQEPALARLVQRIRQRQTIDPFCAKELSGYLMHCFDNAGGDFEQIFSSDAAALLHELTGGIPRVANNLVESSLAAAAKRNERQVTAELLSEIANAEYGLVAKTVDAPPEADADTEAVLEEASAAEIEAAFAPAESVLVLPDASNDSSEPPNESRIDDVLSTSIEDTMVGMEALQTELVAENEAPDEIPELAADPVAQISPVPEAEPEPEPEEIPELAADPVEQINPVPEAESDPEPEQIPELAADPVEQIDQLPEAESDPEPDEIPEFAAEPVVQIDQLPEAESDPVPEEIPELAAVPVAQIIRPPEPEHLPDPEPENIVEQLPESSAEISSIDDPLTAMPDIDSQLADRIVADDEPTQAGINLELDALEPAAEFALVDDFEEPINAIDVSEDSTKQEADSVPEITLDAALDQRVEEKETDSEKEKIAQELATARSIEDIDDKMAETLFGAEFDLVASQVLASPPPSAANTPLIERADDTPEPAAATAETEAEAAQMTPTIGATAIDVNPDAPVVAPTETKMDLMATQQRLSFVRSLNGDSQPSEPTLEQPTTESTAEPEPVSNEPPESIEAQINTSITQTVQALKLEDIPDEADAEEVKQKSGFFSRFKRS